MSTLLTVAASSLLFLAGCSSLPPAPESLGAPPTDIHRTSVALAQGQAERLDSIRLPGGREGRRFFTGERWQAVFARPGPSSTAILRIVSCRIDMEIVAIGFHTNFTYTSDAVLTLSNGDQPLHSVGTSSTFLGIAGSVQTAVDEGIKSMADQAEAALQQSSAGAAVPSTVANRLRELAKLFEEGVISRGEYEAKKKQLLEAL